MEKDNNINKPEYSIPNDYFVSFQDRLATQIAFEELVGTSKSAGFIVPDGYFDTLPTRIITNTTTSKVVQLSKAKWYYAVASIAAILAVLFFVIPSSISSTSFEDLESNSITTYLELEDSSLSEYDLGSLLSDDELNNLSESITLEDTELIEYLNTTTDSYDLMIH